MKFSSSRYHILIAEDNHSLREGIRDALVKEGYQVATADDGLEALHQIESQPCHLLITDIKMPKIDGLELFKTIKARFPEIDVILITAYATVEIAVEAIKSGAEDFITKPFALAELKSKVKTLFERWAFRYTSRQDGANIPKIIGTSPIIKKITALIPKVAKSDSPILITGESGTGKELVARAVHDAGPFSQGPFIPVNCAALTESLLESELFGHEKGAFTGAVKAHAGKFEQSGGGTLFLDEIGDMPLSLQVKLLRVLQTKQFQRVGGEKFIRSDFRLISATNQDLQQAVKAKRFRADLFYRINVIPLHIAPLRDRKEDIPLLIDHILKKQSRKLGRDIPRMQSSVMHKLQAYSWPGNIRELENFIERALVFIDENLFTEQLFSFAELEPTANEHTPLPTRDLTEYLEKIERETIITALRSNRGIKQRTAQQLNIKPSTLYYKMDKYAIEEKEYLL